MKEKDKYKEVRTERYENVVVRVHIPELTKEERDRRIKEIGRAVSGLMKMQNNTSSVR